MADGVLVPSCNYTICWCVICVWQTVVYVEVGVNNLLQSIKETVQGMVCTAIVESCCIL